MGYQNNPEGFTPRVGLPPVGVPVALGAYQDDQGGIWLVEMGQGGQKQWRSPAGMLYGPNATQWPAVLRNTKALPFRRMVPVKRRA